MSDIQLKIGSTSFGGWKTLRAETGIEQCAGAFDLLVTDRWADSPEPRKIYAGDACTLLLDDQIVISGYIDNVLPSMDKQRHGMRVVGRDKTMDLIDCSAVFKSGQWKNARLDRIARDICTPFGIDVVIATDIGAAFDSFIIDEGEKAFEALDRAARMRGVLLTTDGSGRLLLTRATTGKASATLIEGENILYGEVITSWKERYSEITVKGQGKGTADEFGAKVAHGSASVKDTSITRYRPLVIIAEHHGKGPSFLQRAEWERNIRRGRGTRARIRVQGWTDTDGRVWRPNTLVNVQAITLGIAEDLLIVKCDFSLSEEGTLCDLQLAHPSAFEVLEGVKATRIGRKASGKNGMEISKKEARDKAKKDKGYAGEIVTFETGTSSGAKK